MGVMGVMEEEVITRLQPHSGLLPQAPAFLTVIIHVLFGLALRHLALFLDRMGLVVLGVVWVPLFNVGIVLELSPLTPTEVLVEVEAAEVKAEGLREEMPPALEVLQERQGIRMQEMEGQVVQVVQVATGGLTETEEQQEKRGLTGTIRPENQGLEEGEAEPQVITL